MPPQKSTGKINTVTKRILGMKFKVEPLFFLLGIIPEPIKKSYHNLLRYLFMIVRINFIKEGGSQKLNTFIIFRGVLLFV